MGRLTQGWRAEAGSAAVEFGLLLPLLITILLGAIDFGRFAYASITLTNAARAGAAVCAYVSCDEIADSAIKQVVQGEAQPYLDISLPDIVVTRPASGAGCTEPDRPCLKVEVSYQFTTLVPWPGIPPSVSIKRSAQVVTAIEAPS